MPDELSRPRPAAPDHGTRALAELFLRDRNRYDAVGRQLAATGASVDIPVMGGSMGISLPAGSVIRVDLADGASCRAGDIVVFRQDARIVAHRALARRGRHLISRGDARIAPDPPVALDRILGRVSAVVRSTEILAPPPLPRRRWLIRLAHGLVLWTTVLALRVSPATATRWVGFLTWTERRVFPVRAGSGAAVI